MKVFVFKTCWQQMLSLLIRQVALCYYFYVLLYHQYFLLPIRSPRFLFRLYAMISSCSNAVLRVEFIYNKCQCFLIICFTFGNVLLYVITNGIFFWTFSYDLVPVMRLSQFLIIVEILYLEIFRWNLDL